MHPKQPESGLLQTMGVPVPAHQGHPTFSPTHLPTETHPFRCTCQGATLPGGLSKCVARSCGAAGTRRFPRVSDASAPTPTSRGLAENGPENYNSQATPLLTTDLPGPRAQPPGTCSSTQNPDFRSSPASAEDSVSQHGADPEDLRGEGIPPPPGARRRSTPVCRRLRREEVRSKARPGRAGADLTWLGPRTRRQSRAGRTVGPRSGWSRPSPETNGSHWAWLGAHRAGRQAGRSRPGLPLGSRARGLGPAPQPGPAQPGPALWNRSPPDQKWSPHRGGAIGQ